MTAEVNSTTLLNLVVGMGNANFDKGGGYPVLIIGEKGVGKTEIMQTIADQLAKERGQKVNLTFLYLSTQDQADLLGMPYRNEEENKTYYARPEWFPDTDSEECHIIVCDEYNRSPVYVQQTMLPFSIGGQLHTHILPKKHMVIFLCNPASDNYHVSHFNDAAFYDRMLRLSYAPSLNEWLNHAEKNGVAECVIATAIKLQEKMIKQEFVKEEDSIQVTPSNRTYTKLGILINYFKKQWIEQHGETLAAGYVGRENAIPIMKEFRNLLDKVLKPEDILFRMSKEDQAWLHRQTRPAKYEAGKIAEMNLSLRRYICKNLSKVVGEKGTFEKLGMYLSYIGDDQILEFNTEFVQAMEATGHGQEKQRDFLCNLNRATNNDYYLRAAGEVPAKPTPQSLEEIMEEGEKLIEASLANDTI